ncbi:MAG: metal ABC transporter substrate-binding protein [Puniceicoccaceae bacterium]
MKKLSTAILALFATVSCLSGNIKIATLHPLIADLAGRIGGDQVTLFQILDSSDDVHIFEPKPRDFALISEVKLILISGKGLEASYLNKLTDNLSSVQKVVDVGRTIPSLLFQQENADHHHHGHDHAGHSHGVLDPHWWHDVQHMRRAARTIEQALSEADPDNRALYRSRSKALRDSLNDLDRWVRSEVSSVPKKNRIIASAHHSFGYFCAAYGFEAVPIQGISHQEMPGPRTLAAIMDNIRKSGVPVVFYESSVNPILVERVSREAKVKLAGPLYPGGTGIPADFSYEDLVRHNVGTIVSALATAQ